jgi:hypothetical protein
MTFIEERRPDDQQELLDKIGKRVFIKGRLYEWRPAQYGFDGWHELQGSNERQK